MPGLHLLLDGTATMPLTVSYLYQFLTDLVAHVNMTIIQGPVVYKNLAGDFDGWVILAESHCAIHVYGQIVFVDAFSCKGFDTIKATEFVKCRLGMEIQNITVIERPLGGLHLFDLELASPLR